MNYQSAIEIFTTISATILILVCTALFMVRREWLPSPFSSAISHDQPDAEHEISEDYPVLEKEILHQDQDFRILKPPRRSPGVALQPLYPQVEEPQYPEYDFNSEPLGIGASLLQNSRPKVKRAKRT